MIQIHIRKSAPAGFEPNRPPAGWHARPVGAPRASPGRAGPTSARRSAAARSRRCKRGPGGRGSALTSAMIRPSGAIHRGATGSSFICSRLLTSTGSDGYLPRPWQRTAKPRGRRSAELCDLRLSANCRSARSPFPAPADTVTVVFSRFHRQYRATAWWQPAGSAVAGQERATSQACRAPSATAARRPPD